MPALIVDTEMADAVGSATPVPEYGFVVSHQKVELEVNFAAQTVSGTAHITILPSHDELRTIRIDARQCDIPARSVLLNGKVVSCSYDDPLRYVNIPDYLQWGAEQWEMQQERIRPVTEDKRAEGALVISLPAKFKFEAVDPFTRDAGSVSLRASTTGVRASSSALDKEPQSAGSVATPKGLGEQAARYQPLEITIPFTITNFRDGLHWVGLADGDLRFPNVFTKHSTDPGTASCIFPCIDDPSMRCTWDISIKCAKTLGDALKRHTIYQGLKNPLKRSLTNGLLNGISGPAAAVEEEVLLSPEEKRLEMTVVCSGEQMDEVVDLEDSSKKIVSFQCGVVVAAQHIGFAIGPYEQVELSEWREQDDEEKLGQSHSLPVYGYCLPGRAAEVQNTCMAVAHAVDWISLTFGCSFPFTDAKLVFVDDQVRDVEHTAGLSICSTRLLFPQDIIDPERESTRTLTHAIASQWIGVSIIPENRSDRWATIGLSHFMTDLYMKHLFGNNDYQFRQKQQSDRVVELDINRPTLIALGEILNLGQFEYDFMALKSRMVLFILDKRLIKASGTAGLTRVIQKIITGANTGGESTLTSEGLRKWTEKTTKYRETISFWEQWVHGSGCPRFHITQKFNKKRLCVEMKISQKQGLSHYKDAIASRPLNKNEFVREFKEEVHDIFAGDIQNAFTGPMTIRIHEADGTPYEHIVDLREGYTTFDIPYNTKYKRLKRTRRQRERATAAAAAGFDPNAEAGEDTLYYCLGDNLTTQAEMWEWGLTDWPEAELLKMAQESYEWIRIDADFEWLCHKEIQMEAYMYISQLQQDRDVVAQQESMIWLKSQGAHKLAATFLIRTLMDPRYFHGIRTMAAEILTNQAAHQVDWVGLQHLEKAYAEYFCYPGTSMPQPNDFSDKAGYWISKAIPRAMSQIRDTAGNCPKRARDFLYDQLNFNDNRENDYSDQYKIAGLLEALTDCLIPKKKDREMIMFDEDEDNIEPANFRDKVLGEFDRFLLNDEYTLSFQNIHTVTILDCKRRLMQAKVIPVDAMDFVQYLNDGTSDQVRIKAFQCLIELGLMANVSVLTYLLNVMSSDSSPYVRQKLFDVFGIGLALVAFGSKKTTEAPVAQKEVQENGFTIVAGEEQTGERKDHIERTTTIAGALAALKKDIKDNEALKTAIWHAIKSSTIDAVEQMDLLYICGFLYNPVESMHIKLKLPRYWKAEKVGKAEILFKQTSKVRLMPITAKPTMALKPAAQPVVERPQAPIRLISLKTSNSTSMPPPAAKNTLKRSAPSEERIPSTSSIADVEPPAKRQKNILTLKVNSVKLEQIARSPPNPGRYPKAPSATPPSRRQSPASVRPSSSPAFRGPSASPAPAPTSEPGLKIRRPLPDGPARTPLPDIGRVATPARREPLPSSPAEATPVPKTKIVKLKLKTKASQPSPAPVSKPEP